jgi:hypothetical protein
VDASTLGGVLLTQRSERQAQDEDRRWAARADLYRDLLRWIKVQEDVILTEDWGEIDLPLDPDATEDLFAHVQAFGSSGASQAFYMLAMRDAQTALRRAASLSSRHARDTEGAGA